MPKKRNSEYYSNKVQKRWKNMNNTVECEVAENQQVDSNYSDNVNEPETLQTNQLESPKLSVRVKNLPSASSDAQEVQSNFEYILVDTRLLTSLLSKVNCQDCGGTNLKIVVSNEKQGFVHKLCTVCEDCEDGGSEHVKSEIYTSKRVSNSSSSRPPFDLNMRIVMAFSQLGKGYAGIEKFAMIMNMTTFQRKTFDTCTDTLHTACNKVLDLIYKECRGHVKECKEIVEDDSDPNDLVDIGVSYDGSWLTRGYKSKYGVGCVVNMVTGYVIDSHVMSKYCPICKVAIADLGEESPEFAIWMEGHVDECQANHEGSSGSMEIAAATSIWLRSEKFGFRYTTMLSDGDSKTFNHLTSLNVYGTTIKLKKEECFNHVSKRAYTGIKNAVTLWKARKVTLGGRSHGSLKETTIQKLAGYYKNALYRNKGNIQINERSPLLGPPEQNMAEKVGISQQTLVSNNGLDTSARKFPQYAAGLASTLGALAAGMVLAWTSPAGIYVDSKTKLTKLADEYKIPISSDEFSWIGSLTTLGAATICVPIGILSDIIGRKNSMLILVVPFTIGWGIIIWANSVEMFYIGRFITGLSGGAFCVTAPMYTAEIGESQIRGQLGSYFQLMLTAGILLTYVLGKAVTIFELSIISAIVPIVFFIVFFFMPESPTYYLMKGNVDAARSSLTKLRGPDYNVEPELLLQQETLEDLSRNRVPFLVAIRSKAAIKGLIIAFGLMFFQQLSGVNAIIFYAANIFANTGSTLSSEDCTIILGVIQCASVFVSAMIVDKLGRRILLLISEVAMFSTTLIVGVYFYMQEQKMDVSSIGWLPLTSVCLFIILFSLGFGPIPWMMMGELFSLQIKGMAGSAACLFNWLMAFIVTKFFNDLTVTFGNSVTFWIFSVICAIGFSFVLLIVPETKGKTLQEIQLELEGN